MEQLAGKEIEGEGGEVNNDIRSYSDWCAYYQPLFENSPYSLGHQLPDESGLYSWSHALETANQMVIYRYSLYFFYRS